MKDGGLGESLLFPPSHREKPVLNGLSDLLRLPQYPVLGVRASAHLGAARGRTIRARAGGGKGVSARAQDGHKPGKNGCLGRFPGRGRPGLGRKPHGPRQQAGLRRPWTRGGAQAERPPPAERPPEAGGVAASPAHQGRTPSYAAPLPESADNGPAPQTTGLSRPGRPGLSVGQGTGTRASPLGGQSRPP